MIICHWYRIADAAAVVGAYVIVAQRAYESLWELDLFICSSVANFAYVRICRCINMQAFSASPARNACIFVGMQSIDVDTVYSLHSPVAFDVTGNIE